MSTGSTLFGWFVVLISVLAVVFYEIQTYKKKKQKEKLEERTQWKRNFDSQQKIGNRIFSEVCKMNESSRRFRVIRDISQTDGFHINIEKRGNSGRQDVLVYQVDVYTDSCFGTQVGVSIFKGGEKTTATYNADGEGINSALRVLEFLLSN